MRSHRGIFLWAGSPNRISLGLHYFILAGVLSFSVAVLTTAFLAGRAALANPVDSLRYE